MIWDRCANAIENTDYEGCHMELLQTLAMETPFTEEEFRNEKKEKLSLIHIFRLISPQK